MSNSPIDDSETTHHAQVPDSENAGVENVAWNDLWEEFGFDTVDAVGSRIISKTQLIAAIECSEQGVQGDPLGHIDDAVDSGPLLKKSSSDGSPQGYILVGGQSDE